MKKTISDFLVAYLDKLDIDKVFGVAGGVVEPFLNSIGKNKKFEAINFASENQSCFIAQSYGEAKNSFGVCFSIWGAGETNLINATSSAYLSNKKLLIIVASGNQNNEARSPAQDSNGSNGINSLGIFNNITVYNEKITNKNHFEDKLRQAIIKMYLHNRPVRLEIPKNILEEELDFEINDIEINIPEKPLASKKDIEYLLNIIKNEKVNFFIGSGAEKIKKEILEISELYSHNIFETSTGKGIFNKNSLNYKGVFGISGQYQKNSLENSSFNFLIGDPLNEENTNGWSEDLVNNLVYITDIFDSLNSPLKTKKTIYSDIKQLFTEISEKLELKEKYKDKTFPEDSKNQCTNEDSTSEITPENLIKKMSEISNNKTVAFFDIGNSFLWGIKYWNGKEHYKNLQNFKIGTGLSTMGWALGSSIGYSIAKTEETVFCFIGDGSILMSSNEILMLKEKSNKIVFIILNDGLLGTVFHGQNLSNSLSMCNKIPKINFQSIFESNGINSYTIKTDKDIENISKIINDIQGPIVLDVHIDKTKQPPLGQRLKNLQ